MLILQVLNFGLVFGINANILVQLTHSITVQEYLSAMPEIVPLITYNFSFGSFEGFSGAFNGFYARVLREDPRVAAITDDAPVRVVSLNPSAKQIEDIHVQHNAPRHLARLSQRTLLTTRDSLQYYYDIDGQHNVDVYVIDTGVNSLHPEFEGRVIADIDFTSESPEDFNGHGTHVAGIIGSKTYGVAKDVRIINVKVLKDLGAGNLTSVIAGLSYSVNRFLAMLKSENRHGVVNLSLGAGYNRILNAAVDAAVDAGLPVVVAAGNWNSAACVTSPASAQKAITVGAIDDRFDTIASFSNWGSCVDMFAPGVYVKSLSHVDNGTISMSGTSMAAPSVTGILAMLLAKGHNATVAQKMLFQLATHGAINTHFITRPRTPNLIASNGFLRPSPEPADDSRFKRIRNFFKSFD